MPNNNTVIDLPRHRFGDFRGSLETNFCMPQIYIQIYKHTESHMEVAPPPKKENCGRYKKVSLILKKVINPALAGNLSYFDLYLTSCIVLLCMMIMIPLLECSAQRQAQATDHCLNYLRLHWQVVTGVEFGKCEVMKKFKPVMKNYEEL